MDIASFICILYLWLIENLVKIWHWRIGMSPPCFWRWKKSDGPNLTYLSNISYVRYVSCMLDNISYVWLSEHQDFQLVLFSRPKLSELISLISRKTRQQAPFGSNIHATYSEKQRQSHAVTVYTIHKFLNISLTFFYSFIEFRTILINIQIKILTRRTSDKMSGSIENFLPV